MSWKSVVLVVLVACSMLRDDLGRAEVGYEEARYEVAKVWLRDLEDSVASMDTPMQTRFYYLRGMTSYRLGERNEALHYLSLARESGGESGEGLRVAWRRQLEGALEELTPVGPTWHARPAPN